MNSARCFFVVLSLLLWSGAKHLTAAPKPVFSLALNAAADTPEPANAPPQILCIYINGNPAHIFVGGNSVAMHLNQFLKPGANEFRITDTAKRSWSIQLGMMEFEKEPVLVLEKEASLAGSGEFSVTVDLPKVDWSLPLFKKEITDKDLAGESVLKFLGKVFTALAAENKSSFHSLVTKDGRAIWQKEAFGADPEMEAGAKAQMEEFFKTSRRSKKHRPRKN